jgi:uncharacterized protein
MSRPGVEVYSSAATPPQGVPTDTSVAFVVGEAQQGPLDQPTRITSLDDFTAVYGARVTGVESYDSLDAAFHEGLSTAYFMRMADAGAKVATASAAAIVAGNTLDAANAGAWGNSLKLDVAAISTTQSTTFGADEDDGDGGTTTNGDGSDAPQRSALLTFPDAEAGGPTFIATVTQAGKIVQVSQPLATRRDLSSFLQQASYLTLTGPDSDDPIAAGSVTPAGGADGTMPVTDATVLPNALLLMPKELGPGQLLAPGKTDGESHAALLAAAAGSNRVALLDGNPDDTPQALISAAAALRGAEEDRYGSLWAPWAVIPGIAPGTSRTVPWSAIQAGLCARNDRAGNPNQAAAGSWGQSVYAIGLTETFSPADCEAMLYAGVDTARSVYGTIEAYAFRTLVDPNGPRSGWRELNHARLNMAIVADSEAIGQDFVFSQLDGRGHTIASFGGQLAGMLIDFYNADALFGDDPTQAFQVNVGPAVNTDANLADGILKAVLTVRMSPHAELVQIYIVKQPITVALV